MRRRRWCVLAIGERTPAAVSAKIDEFLKAKTPVADIRAWATAERAKALAPAATVVGTQPVQGMVKPKGFAMTAQAVLAKRAQELDEDRRKNPLIKRIGAVA
jgi:hypothetical protein